MIGNGSGNDHSGFQFCSKEVSGVSWCAFIRVHSPLLYVSVTEGPGGTGLKVALMVGFTEGEISGVTTGEMEGGGTCDV